MSRHYFRNKSLLLLLLFGVLFFSIISVIFQGKFYSQEANWKSTPASVGPVLNLSTNANINTTKRGAVMFLTKDLLTLKFKPGQFGATSRRCVGNFYTPSDHYLNPPEISSDITEQIAQCKSTLPFVKVTYEGHLVYEDAIKVQNLTCCLHEIKIVTETRKTKNVTIVSKRNEAVCTKVNASGTKNSKKVLLDEDFPHVSCQWNLEEGKKKSKELYLSNFQLTKHSNFKTQFWKGLSKVSDFKMPSSVFILGLSSISTNQFLTHFPSTHRFLAESGFQRFKNYVKSGNGMLENFYPILTGKLLDSCLTKTNGSVKAGCDTLRSKYAELNYVTFNGILDDMYSNFFKQASDFTVIPLLKSYENGMKNQVENEEQDRCFQYNFLVELLFSYTSEFLLNFSDLPYFGTLWLEPFVHQKDPGSLQLIDYLLSTFLTSNQQNLANTIVILVSDEGFSEVGSVSTDGTLENHFPAMYVRLPESLHTQIHFTSHEGLISYGRLHDTLLKNLHLSCKEMVKESIGHLNNKSRPSITKACNEIAWKVGNTSASALWDLTPTSELTNCSSSGILPHYCFCSAHLAPKNEMAAEDIVEDSAQFVVNFINDFIDTSFPPEKQVGCAHWVLEAGGILFNSTVLVTYPVDLMGTGLEELKRRKELFIVIRVQAFDITESLGQVRSHLYARIRLGPTQHESSGMTLVDFPIRIPGKGEFPKKYSQCVSNLNNHQLQSICYCKQPPPVFGHIVDTLAY